MSRSAFHGPILSEAEAHRMFEIVEHARGCALFSIELARGGVLRAPQELCAMAAQFLELIEPPPPAGATPSQRGRP